MTYIPCTPVRVPTHRRYEAALVAIAEQPMNAPFGLTDPPHIGVVATKFWGDRVRNITVGFMETTSAAMRQKVLLYANKWGEFSKARFVYSATSPMIRVGFGPGGYYSYLGPDCFLVPAGEQTMNLEGFTVDSPDAEWDRVVVHEFGHALGCPHEHARQAIIDLLDPAKVIASFEASQGWTEAEIRQQILVPQEEWSLMGASPTADQTSIMCYDFDGSVTKSGQPIPGGRVLSAIDREYFSRIYPADAVPTPVDPPGPKPTLSKVTSVALFDAKGKELARFK